MPSFGDKCGLTDFDTPDKCCSVCAGMLPADEIHFDRDSRAPDGLRDECKVCRAERRNAKAEKEAMAAVAQLDRAALNLLGRATSKDYSKVPHIGEVFECLMRVFGGPQGYAEHFSGTYLTAKPGSQQRVKLLSIISMMANQVTLTGVAKVPKDLLSDEDLEREIKERILSIAGTVEDKEVA